MAEPGILDIHSLFPFRLKKYNSLTWSSQVRSIVAARFSGRDRSSKAVVDGFEGMIGELLSGRV